jgi:carbon-monoxide dehydrogenase medium subunit
MTQAAVMHAPETQDEVLDVLAEHGEAAKIVAGGTAFMILRKAGLLQPEHVVSPMRVAELRGVAAEEGSVSIGALTLLRDVQRSREVRRDQPVLAAALTLVANTRIRNVATMGGNVSEADPTSDPPAVLTALDAVVHIASTDGERQVPMRDFYRDYFESVLRPEELVTRIVVPALGREWGGTYLKFLSRSAEDRTCLGVAAFARSNSDGVCTGLRLSVVGATPIPLRLPDVEKSVAGQVLDAEVLEQLADRYVEASDPVSDVRGSAEYRKRVLAPLIVRAVRRAAAHQNGAVLA